VPNELLNFAVCASKQLNASTLSAIIGGFYHDDELVNAKVELCKFQQTLPSSAVIDGWDKLVNKHGGPIKRQGADPSQRRLAEADDIVQMLSLLTVSKAVLPCFVTVNLERVPPMTWRGGPAAQSLSVDDDVCSVGALAAGIANLSTSMNAVLMRLDAVERKFSGPGHHTEAVTAIVPGGTSRVSVLSKLSSAVTRSDELSTLNTTGSAGSWASRVASTAAAQNQKLLPSQCHMSSEASGQQALLKQFRDL
jgi:hypothetical protein